MGMDKMAVCGAVLFIGLGFLTNASAESDADRAVHVGSAAEKQRNYDLALA